MLNFTELDLMMKASEISANAVTRMAGLHPRYISRLRSGEVPLTSVMANRIRLAIARIKRGETAIDGALPSACYRFAIAYVAREKGRTPDFVLSADPGRRATADKIWMEASQLRRWALYIANVYLNIPQAELARAAGMSKAAVSYAMNDVEDERGDPELEKLLAAVEGAFSS
jgi:transcriptional regulator with XRE-family HTH domain